MTDTFVAVGAAFVNLAFIERFTVEAAPVGFAVVAHGMQGTTWVIGPPLPDRPSAEARLQDCMMLLARVQVRGATGRHIPALVVDLTEDG